MIGKLINLCLHIIAGFSYPLSGKREDEIAVIEVRGVYLTALSVGVAMQ